MSKVQKKYSKMMINPQGWRIEDLKGLASRMHITFNQPGTSHVTFRFPDGKKLTVPAHKPIKAVYIKLFIEMMEGLGGMQ